MPALIALLLLAVGPDEDARAALALSARKPAPKIEAPKYEVPPPLESATIKLTVPASAIVWIDGASTTSTGTERTYLTPLLAGPGTYRLKVQADRLYERDVAVRPGETTALKIGAEVAAEAIPFPAALQLPKGGELRRQAADDDEPAAGPWPKELPKPAALKPFRRAKFTQSLSQIDYGDGRGFMRSIERVPRDRLLAKWQVPGGLEGVHGWRSQVYRTTAAREWKALVPVLNSYGFHQREVGWSRTYPDGALFADVLVNADGRVFEVRYAEKTGDVWDRYVAYKDPDARPAGYTPPKRADCRSCHAEAGTGGYATGLVPGGDEVISDPYEEIG